MARILLLLNLGLMLAATLLTSSSASSPPPAEITSTSPTGATLSTAETPHSPTKGATLSTAETPHSPTKGATLSTAETPHSPTEIKSTTTEATPEPRTTGKPSPTPSGAPSTTTTSTPPGPLRIFNVSFHITNENFSAALENSASREYIELKRKIGSMYNSIYNCSTCSLGYAGFILIAFRPGSVAVDSELSFESKNTSAKDVEHRLSTADNASRANLTLDRVTATLLTSSSASSPPPAGITSTSPTGATLSTAETPHSPTKGATLSTAETPHSPTKGATLSTAETPHSPTEIKSTTTEATPEPRTTGKPSPTPSGAPSTTTTSTPPGPLRIFNVSFHITNENFSAALENSASREYIELKRKIGSMYNSIYNCSTCSLGYAGFTLIAFRPGSVAVDSELSFESKNMSAKDVEHRLNTADNASRANLTLDRVTATLLTSSSASSPPPAGITSTSPTGATLSTAETPHSPTEIKSTTTEATPEPRTTGKPSPTPSGAPSTTTTSTPPGPLRIFNVSFHITNENFSAALENSASREYIELKRKIGSMYNSIYNCSTCSLGYAGFTLIAFRPGSVAVDSELSFESKNMSAKDVEHRLNTADNASRANLTLDRVTATLLTSSSASSPPPAEITSTSPTGATLSTAETPHSPTKGATLSTAETPHSPTKGATLSTAETPHSPTEIKSTTTEATPEPRTTGKPSPTPSGTPSTTTTSTPPLPLRIFNVSFHITNENFSAALENSASREYIELKRKIGSMYNSIYNCSTCSLGYAGFILIAFRPGSVAVDSELSFESKNMSAKDVEHRLNTADNASRANLTLDRVTATLLTSSSASSPPPAEITSTSPTGATLSTAETPHSPTKGATLSTAETPHSPTEIKSTTTEATPEPRTTGKPSPTPSGAPSTTTTSTPPGPLRIFNVSFHITNENFSAALENSASREYIELKRKIGSMYNSIYNCSTCSLGYAGFILIAFRPGSVAVDSELSFESKNMSAKDVEHRLSTADNASRANLTLDRVTATLLTSSSTSSPPPAGITSTSPTGATLSTAETPHSPTKGATLSTAEAPHSPTKGETLSTAEAPHSPTKIKSTISEATPEPRTTGKPSRTPSGAPSTTTTSTPPVPLRIFDVSFHITNKNFSAALENSASREYIELKSKIGSMYNSIYNCSTCSLGYAGFTLIAFRPGSVAVESQILFQNKDMSARDIEHRLNTADSASRGGLILDRVTVTSTSPGPTSAPKTVPGWGIALLVLVCILVFFLILGLLVLLIHWCRRNQRGNMELLSNHEAYHPMNEYPTYQTHGRYMAPGNKQNPYNETQPKNGTRPFSYTNTAMANDDL